MSDEIRRLSEELAREPSSLVFVQLGEALRRSRQPDLALQVARRGLERHPHHPAAHDLLARVHVDRGELQDALDEWSVVLAVAPEHAGARRGMGYVLFKQGRLEEAEQQLAAAARADGADAGAGTALRMVRRMLRYTSSAPAQASPAGASMADAQQRVQEEARCLFAEALGDADQTALLLDGHGLVLAGAYVTSDGTDVAQEIGAALAGTREEITRVTQHLHLGAWTTLVAETRVATIAMAPVMTDSLVLAAAARSVPLGLVRRLLDRCARRATTWLTEDP
ncbi:MAG TPA: tetratricopeptide repeat protein [Gemmatimonadaceae bacterium]|jgi:tetratricopeptide (TPR) repeat protein